VKILPSWLREFVELKVDDRRLAADLTLAGISVESISGAGGDAVFDMEITTNRVDAMNHYGVARECSAIYDLDLRPLTANLDFETGHPNFAIEIAEPRLCGRYTARIVRGTRISPSPPKIAQRLSQNDARPINNAADATNYNLIEMGHPTHAFDLDRLAGGKIIVRLAREGERLKMLDGVERKLSAEDLVIADASKPVALAGVMGGFDSMITESTRNALIESAWFDPVSIRKTARRHGLHTDASHRFERGADWGATPLACARVAGLLLASGGGQLQGGEIDVIGRRLDQERPALTLARREVRRILGAEVPQEDISRILRRLGFEVTAGRAAMVAFPAIPAGVGGTRAAVAEEAADFSVRVPTWRLDVEREIDLIEEIARLHGYDRFPNTLPAFSGGVRELPEAAKDARLRATTLALGYHEAVSTSFISRQEAQLFSSAPPVALANPLSEEAACMRTSLAPGMLGMLAWNLNRGVENARLFELGAVFALSGKAAEERKVLCLGATGSVQPAGVHQQLRRISFFDIKGDVEAALAGFEPGTVYYDAHAPDYYHPGRCARAVLDGAAVAQFGQVHPQVAATRKLRQEIFLAEIFLDRLYRRALRQPRYQAIPRFPEVERDFSFLFDAGITFERIRSAVQALGIAALRDFNPVEIFRGEGVPTGKYSVLLRATFQSAEGTLRDEEVALWSAQLIHALKALGGSLRS